VIVRDEKLRNAILTALADKDVMLIMDCALYKQKPANDIIRETGISHSTAYRKIKWMVDEGLMIVSNIQITEDGKKSSLFRSTMKSLNASYHGGVVEVQAEKNPAVMESAAETFFSLNPS
jgi:hypothetical protein